MVYRQARLLSQTSSSLHLSAPFLQPCRSPKDKERCPLSYGFRLFVDSNRPLDPLHWPGHANPMPYDVLSITNGSTPMKSRFYEPVTLYRPDRHFHNTRTPHIYEFRRFVHTNRHPDPLHWPGHPNPTPYDIFNITNGSTYTKSRFYELVKLYHPDSHCHNTRTPHISPDVRIERYRLVILANDILSDPAKRRAYDIFGVGWTAERAADKYKGWRTREGTAANNANWEDWERWRDAANGKKPEPVYMSHGSFAALVVAFVSLGVVAQTTRVDARTKERLKAMQERQRTLSSEVGKRAEESSRLGRYTRVESFAREREHAIWGYKPDKFDSEQSATKSA